MTDDRDVISTSTPYVASGSARTSDAWAAEATAAGRRGTQTIAWAREVPAATPVAAALDLPDGSPVVTRRRVVLLDDQPVELADSYYPPDIAVGTALAEPAKIRGGAAALLANLGHIAAEVLEDITARMPTDEEQAALQVGPSEPLLILARVSVGTDGRPFEYAVMTMVARGRVLHYRTQGG
jgi:GntR family transcriptional regulator